MEQTEHDKTNVPKNTHPDPLFEAPVEEKCIEYIFYHPKRSLPSNAPCIQGVLNDGCIVTIISDADALTQAKNSADHSKRAFIVISKEKEKIPLQNPSELLKHSFERIDLTELYKTEEKEKTIVTPDREQAISFQKYENTSSEQFNEQVLEFIVADTHFAIPLLKTREIVPKPDIIYQPDASPHIRGTIVHRTRAIPVVDLRSLFAMPDKKIGSSRERLIIIHGVGNHACSILVDTVLAVTKIEQDEINDPIRDHASAPFACGSMLRKGEKERYVMHILNADSIIQCASRL